MAVPKQRKTKSRRNQRRMHIHLDAPTMGDCPQCKEKKLMHAVCKACGYYKGKEIIDVLKEKKSASKKKEEAKEEEKSKKSLTMESLSKKDKSSKK
jgi:large subunit ribosomal protein L32